MSTPDQNLLRIEGDYTPNPNLVRIQNNYAEAIAAVNQIAEALGLTRNKDLPTILQAIADLKTKAKASTETNELIAAIAVELGLTDFQGENLINAIATLKGHSSQAIERMDRYMELQGDRNRVVEVLQAIANALGYEYIDSPQIKDTLINAIAYLKDSNLKMLKDRVKPEKINILPHLLGEALNLGDEFDDDDILKAIANLKHSLQLSQNEAQDEALQRSAIDAKRSEYKVALEKSKLREDHWHKKYTELEGNCDRDELQSERDYYRGILDKLCDRLNAENIEALEHVAKHQEMDLDFTSQHNDDLREQLAESQAIAYRYIGRICELEKEVRSLKEPLPETMDRFMKGNSISIGEVLGYRRKPQNIEAPPDSDRLSNSELIQIIRGLLK